MLDVATGSGMMVRFLVDRLAGYDEVVGIDRDATVAPAFAERFPDDPRIRFETMDALEMSFPAGSFDTVSMSHGLCEFTDSGRVAVLHAIRRVTRPGGAMIINDSPRDQPTEAQLTHVLLHDWWSDVDAHTGVVHLPFQTRTDLVAQLEALDLENLRLFDVPDDPRDPLDPEQLSWIDGVIDASLERVIDEPALTARGVELRERMHRVGFSLATAQLAVGHVAG